MIELYGMAQQIARVKPQNDQKEALQVWRQMVEIIIAQLVPPVYADSFAEIIHYP